jgi:MFS family permease
MRSAQSQPGPRSVVALLGDPVFGRYFLGKVAFSFGLWIQNVVGAIVMWNLTRSATAVGAISMVQFTAPIVLAPWTGALTDRLDRRRSLIAASAVCSTAAIALATAAMLGLLTSSLLIAVTLVSGVGLALQGPAMQALLPALVPLKDLQPAVALNAMSGTLARAGGPALGTALLLLGGPVLAFGGASLAFGSFAAALIGLRTRPRPRRPAVVRVFGGFQYAWSHRELRLLLLATGALGFGIDPVMTLAPALVEEMGRTDGAVGMLATLFGTGAMVAALAMSALRRRHTIPALGAGGLLTTGLGLAVVAAVPVYGSRLTGFAIAGAGFLTATTALTTRVHALVDDDLRGRVMAVWTMAWLGGRPFAALSNGLVADATSASAALWVGVLATVSMAAITGRRPS